MMKIKLYYMDIKYAYYFLYTDTRIINFYRCEKGDKTSRILIHFKIFLERINWMSNIRTEYSLEMCVNQTYFSGFKKR